MNLKIEKQQRKVNETESQFFENINKINKLLRRQGKKKREKTQVNNIMNEPGDIMTDPEVIKRIWKYYKPLYVH